MAALLEEVEILASELARLGTRVTTLETTHPSERNTPNNG